MSRSHLGGDHARPANCARRHGARRLLQGGDMPGTPGLACCAACGGFILDPAAPCLHCDAPAAPRRRLARFLLTAILGAAASVTLMACYGMTYECDGPNGQCTGVCYQDSDCGTGEYCDDSTATCEWGGYCYNVGECPTGY